MASSSYTASDIEVLSGLDPVRRRPGMYTDTTRPNHLAHEVVDNSVDEALAGFCENINVTLFKDGSLQVEDDGRGMPVDIHPKEKVSGVELILTRLHAGGKFSDKTDKFSVPQLKHTLKAKAVLAPGLRVKFFNEATGEKDEWFYSGDLGEYLLE